MLIGICFGDNDFNATVWTFLRVLASSTPAKLRPSSVTKLNVVKLWRALAPGLYLATQAGLDATIEDAARVASFVEESHVFLNFECERKLVIDNNGEFSCVDTDTGEVSLS